MIRVRRAMRDPARVLLNRIYSCTDRDVANAMSVREFIHSDRPRLLGTLRSYGVICFKIHEETIV